MARRSQQSSAAGVVIVALAGIALLTFILKTLLITAAILAVPFGVWWFWDRRQRRATPQPPESAAPVDPVAEAMRADELGLTESAEYWRGHYEPHHHDVEAARKREQDVARNRKVVLADVHQRSEEARQRIWERAAREAERRRAR